MTQLPTNRPPSTQPLPWYRYPWPWVAIAIPGVAVIGGLFTLYLAINNPDPLVMDDYRYDELRSELLADPAAAPRAADSEAAAGDEHHERDGNP